jgi:hypothetical protein
MRLIYKPAQQNCWPGCGSTPDSSLRSKVSPRNVDLKCPATDVCYAISQTLRSSSYPDTTPVSTYIRVLLHTATNLLLVLVSQLALRVYNRGGETLPKFNGLLRRKARRPAHASPG